MGLGLWGCNPTPPPKSAPLTLTDVKVQQSEHRPTLIKLERTGDPWPALAAALVHGYDAESGRVWATVLQKQLAAAGLRATVRAFANGLVVSVPLGNQASAANPVNALRDALRSVPANPRPNRDAGAWDACGLRPETNPTQVAAGYHNVVLAAVGDGPALDRVTTWYNDADAWPTGTAPTPVWPTDDAAASERTSGNAELVVARRTPLRTRSAGAAYTIADPDSTLGLLAHSFAGRFQMLEAQSNFVPGGACVAVRLQGQEAVEPQAAARAARAIARELERVLAEQPDEDPRFGALEAFTAQDGAERAAWLAAVELAPSGEQATAFAYYRGPRGDTDAFVREWQKDAALESVPLQTRDEPGQGHLWAYLVNSCVLQHETASTAGHTWGALTTLSKNGDVRHPLRATTFAGHVGLRAFHTARGAGAEDALAETLGRSILGFHRDSFRIAELRSELRSRPLTAPAWALALKLATGNHPSWLTAQPTTESLAALGPESAAAALESFVAGQLELQVLTTKGDDQAQRLSSRLTHLLSGLRQRSVPCLPPSARVQQMPVSGEYAVEAPVGTPAVLLYVLDSRFAAVVRSVATALNREGGWLERSVPPAAFPVHVSAVGLGSDTTLAALAFGITAETDVQLTATVAQVRELVRRLSVTNLGIPTQPDPADGLLPERRVELLSERATDQKALLEELLSRALPTATVVFVKPVRND